MPRTIFLERFTSDKFKSLEKDFKLHLEETDRGSSVKSYLADIKKFGVWIINKYGGFNAGAVTPLDMVEYRRHLQEKGGRNGAPAAPATVNRALVSLKIFFGWLVKKREVKDNPVEDIKMVAVAATPAPKWLDRNEQNRIFRIVREASTRDEAIIGLLLHAGLRVGELCSLSRDSIYMTPRPGNVAVTGKGNKYREIPLNSTVRKILERWLKENPDGPLFPNHRDKSISVRGVFHLVIQYAYLAKLHDVTPHTFRHTFCKNLIDMGVPIDQVAMLAGHSRLDITKRYTAPSMADLEAAVERTAWE